MTPRRSLSPFIIGAGLLAVAATIRADAPSAPWVSKAIGSPVPAGSVDRDARGIWSIQSNGQEIGGSGQDDDHPPVTADSFQYVYQAITGDGSITARLLGVEGGDPFSAKSGLMIRANETAGGPNVNYTLTPRFGLFGTTRFSQNQGGMTVGLLGPGLGPQPNLYVRLQRVGQEIAGFYSRDGVAWVQDSFSPQTLPTLPTTALFGMAVTAGDKRTTATGRFDQVMVQPEAVSAYGIQSCGTDRAVLLQWRPLPRAVGFDLYRGPTGSPLTQMVKLTARPIAGTSFTDTGEGLQNGIPFTSVIVPLFRGSNGQMVPGLPAAVQATPVSVPAGWMGCGLNAGPMLGSAAFDSRSGEITIRGAGYDFWDIGDQGYFFHRLVEGDFQITVRVISQPTNTSPWAKAGLMVRDSLEGGARTAFLVVTPKNGLVFQWRRTANRDPGATWPPAVAADQLTLPLLLRLTRRGNQITPEYSLDNGLNFKLAGSSLTFGSDFPRTISVGLAITSHDRYQMSQATFRDLKIE